MPSALETLFSPATGVVIASMTVLTMFFSAFADEPTQALGRPGLWMVGIFMSAFFGHCVRFAGESRPAGRRARARGVRWPDAVRGRSAGTLEGEATLVAPFSGTPCIAWGIWIASGDEVLLRDARTGDATLVLDDGERVEIAQGRIEIPASRFDVESHPMRIADAFLVERRLHPPPVLGDADLREANHPFAGDVGFEIVILPGSRVVLANPITVETTDSAASYRNPLSKRRVPAGVPVFAPSP
jgi:hypothetical protein